jgi:hypothetical protein
MSTDSLGNDPDSEKLLQDGSDSSSHKDIDEYLIHRRHESRQILRYKFGGMFILILLLVTNLGWWWAHRQADHIQYSGKHPIGPPDLDYCKL